MQLWSLIRHRIIGRFFIIIRGARGFRREPGLRPQAKGLETGSSKQKQQQKEAQDSSRGEITNVGIDAQIAVLEPAFDQRRSDCGYELYCTHLPSLLGNLSRTLNRHQRMRSRSAIPEYAVKGAGWADGGRAGPGGQKIWGCRHVEVRNTDQISFIIRQADFRGGCTAGAQLEDAERLSQRTKMGHSTGIRPPHGLSRLEVWWIWSD